MQLRHAALVQMVALGSIVLAVESGGCATGTTEDSTPTGPAVSAGDTTAATSSSKSSSQASTSSAGGAGSSGSATSTAASQSSSNVSSSNMSSSNAASSNVSSSASSSSGGCGTLYAHTIAIDGTNDFTASETFATSSVGYSAYVAWDPSYLYVGMQGADVGSNDPNKWVVVYIGGAGGTTTGQGYNTQTPTLPFAAKWHVRWKANNTYTNAEMWNGAAWVDAAWSFQNLVYRMGSYVEIAIPRAQIGSPPGVVPVDIGMLNETNGAEGTYAGAPSTAYVDGYNKSFSKYFGFDLGGCNAPATFPPLP